MKSTDAHLPFPTQPLEVAGRVVDEYIIPADQKGAVLRKLYPFVPVPSLDTLMLDVHEEKLFKVGEFRVLRGGDTDWLVTRIFPAAAAPQQTGWSRTPIEPPRGRARQNPRCLRGFCFAGAD